MLSKVSLDLVVLTFLFSDHILNDGRYNYILQNISFYIKELKCDCDVIRQQFA